MSEQSTGDTAQQDRADLARNLALYTLGRLVVIGVVAAVLTLLGVPLLVSLAVAIVVGLPVSWLLLRGLHRRVTAGLAARGAERAEQRERLRAELRGDQ